MQLQVAEVEVERASARGKSAPVTLFVALYVLAFMLTIVLHEVAHAVASALLGGQPVLHHVYVRHRLTSGWPAAAVAAAGPLFSLAQGLLFLALAPVASRWRPAARLFWLWLCAHGLMACFGYLLTSPFMRSGDVGKVAVLLELSAPVTWAFFGVGALGVLAVGAGVTRPLLELAPGPEQVADGRGRRRVILEIGIVPWCCCAVFVALLSYPASHWISYAHDLLSGAFLVGTWRRAARLEPPAIRSEPWSELARWPWFAALAGLSTLFALVLRQGIAVGW